MSFYNFKCSEHDEHEVFTVSMLMSEYDEVSEIIKCPECGAKCHRMIAGEKKHGYIKGNCYLDGAGARRDMNKFTLQENDPYGYMRQDGEVDDMVKRIEKASLINNSETKKIRGESELYKVCPSCKDTLHQDLFHNGSQGRCTDCTPKAERVEYKSQLEKDKEWLVHIITSKKEAEEKTRRDQRARFKEEYGVDIDAE